jgi:hypothetical protein
MPVLVPAAAIAAIAAGWRVGVMVDRWAQERSSLESGLSAAVSAGPAEPPRIPSTRFAADCPTAAPVLVYSPDSTPTAFLVQMTASVLDANRVADSLARHYELQVGGFDDARRGFAIDQAGPATISRLRCEPTVRSLEERLVSR